MVKRIGMRRLAAFAAAAVLVLGLVGCGGAQSTAQGNTEPVILSVWTYYNGDQLESFNKLVDTFNNTVGKEKNITVESYSQGSVNDLETQVMAAAQGKVGASAMPNIFMAYADTAYAMDQMGELADLAPYFTDEERAAYVDSYLTEGDFDDSGSIKIFPVAKSTELLFLNDTDWKLFAAATAHGIPTLRRWRVWSRPPKPTTTGRMPRPIRPTTAKPCLAATRWQTICSSAQKSWATPSLTSRTAR